MKERPILFSGPMVRALIDGTKTQTRRPVFPESSDQRRPALLKAKGDLATFGDSIPDDPVTIERRCRWAPGDRAWVRETWNKEGGALTYRADGDWIAEYRVQERADDARRKAAGLRVRWRPSIHMPKWAARIWLDVLSVRVERLQAISEADALAEGISGAKVRTGPLALVGRPLASEYAHLWDETYPQTPWAASPWVWVVTFKRSEGQP